MNNLINFRLEAFKRVKAGCWLSIIVIFGFVLRIINLKAEPFWGDEVLSLQITRHFSSLGLMIQYLREVEFHPPLYYLFLHFWIRIFGEGTFSLRIISVLFGLAVIVLVYFLGQRIFSSKKVGLLAALIMAVLPIQLEFSQEARPYIIFCFFGGLAALAIWEYFQSNNKRWLLLFWSTSLIGLYLHYSFLLFYVGLSSFWGLKIFLSPGQKRKGFIIWLLTNAAVALGFAYWLPPVFYKLLLGSDLIFGYARSLNSKRIPNFLEFSFDQVIWLTKSIVLPPIVVLVKFIGKILLFGTILYILRDEWSKLKNQKAEFLFLIWISVVPLVLFMFSSQSLPYADIIVRHIILISIPLALIISGLLSMLKQKFFISIFLVFFLSLVPFSTDLLGNDAQWDPEFQLSTAASYINDHYQSGDLLIISSTIYRPDIDYYLMPEIKPVPLTPVDFYGLDVWNSDETLGIVENEFQTRIWPPDSVAVRNKINQIIKINNPKRIWLYGFKANEAVIHDWFYYENWRRAFKSINDILRLDLYVKQ